MKSSGVKFMLRSQYYRSLYVQLCESKFALVVYVLLQYSQFEELGI